MKCKTLPLVGGIFFLGLVLSQLSSLVRLTNDAVPAMDDSAFGDAPIHQSAAGGALPAILKKKKKEVLPTYYPKPTGRKAPPAIQDALCGGCRQLIFNKARGITCGLEIDHEAITKNISLAQAAAIVVKRYKGCQPCLYCGPGSKLYYSYDAAAPKIISATTHSLPSVSQEHRIPVNLLDPTEDKDETFHKLEEYFQEPENHPPKRQYLFDYNPSLILLPDQSHGHVKEEYPDAVYLASYRISNLQGCFPTNVSLAIIGGNWTQRPEAINLLGLALLDKDLKMIQDVVVHIPDMYTHWIDVRLFVFKGQVYATSNCQMIHLWVNPRKLILLSSKRNQKLKNKFPSPLSVAVSRIPAVCGADLLDIAGSKNLNYFTDAQGQPIVEFLPHGPRTLRKINPEKHDLQFGPKPQDEWKDASALPPPSFYTREEIDLPERRGFFGKALTSYRGSACCVSMDVPPAQKSRTNSSTLLLGIAHVKTPFGRKKLKGIVTGNRYLSVFYAFEPTPPYQIVAHSGYFCLPANPAGPNNNNPLADITTIFSLEIGDTVYDCPNIHFITGMIDKADDPTKLIIGYGVQDCTSWFVQVDKGQVADLLFGPPKINHSHLQR